MFRRSPETSAVHPALIRCRNALKLGARGETYDTDPHNRTKELFVAALATFYTVFLVIAVAGFVVGVTALATGAITI